MSEQQPTTWRKPRPIVERVQITGKLELLTSAHFGGGDPDPLSHVKMALLHDPLSGRPLLPGASIAGALRNYLRELELGYDQEAEELAKERQTWASRLFGGYKGDDEGPQSLLIVDDALAEVQAIELRDGVRINPATRTAQEDMLFSLEALPTGTTFDLSFELLVPEGKRTELLGYLALALQGFENSEISLGARKRRGFGRCRVAGWQATCYNLAEPQGLVDWLNQKVTASEPQPIRPALAVSPNGFVDAREYFEMKATFVLDGSLLIRSGFGSLDGSPDTAHLHIRTKNGKRVPIIPGTSWAGVIRHRALKIAKTIRQLDSVAAANLVDSMFGAGNEKDPKAALTSSRVLVADSDISGGKAMVQTRVKLDRFTGGAYETALINQEPVWSNKTAEVKLKLRLRNPADHEIGLLLLVLKDLWTGDLPLGGESSIGRGRLTGKTATLTQCQGGSATTSYTLDQSTNGLTVGEPAGAVPLQTFVDALHTWFKEGEK
jgi:CRISPR/Cas system CSM-associated protein Csm3 (group 7 of RAMP superfamily)